MLKGMITAIRTLTIIPVPGKDTDQKSNALPWFPVVGGFLGILLYGTAILFIHMTGNWFEGAAALIIGASVILTRGIHLDGLADWADGFGGGKNRSHTLAIMKDSNVGAFGILAVILVLLFKYISLVRIFHFHNTCLLVPVYIISRTIMVPLATFLPYARKEGGTANPFVSESGIFHFSFALLLCVILVFVFIGTPGFILIISGSFISLLLGLWFQRRLKGVTGDLLGAGCELTEAGLLFLCASIGQWFFYLFNGRGMLP